MIPTLQLGGLGRRWNQAAAGGGPISARYWRISISANNGASDQAIQEVQIRATVGGADLTTPATPTTESIAYLGIYNAAKTVDNDFTDSNSVWYDIGSSPQWLRYDLGSATSVAEIAITAQNHAAGVTRAPKNFIIEYSADASSWTTAKTVTNSTGWGVGETRAFAL